MTVLTAELCPLDVSELLGRCLGKRELAQRVLSRFAGQLAEDVARLQSAVETGDVTVVAKIAHKIKGAAANVSALAVRERAAAVESAARSEQWSDIITELEQLIAERDEFQGALQHLEWK